MLSSVAAKAMAVGRFASAVFGLALVLALAAGVASVALAAVPGDPFELGRTNSINDALTKLSGSRDGGAMLSIDNNSSASASRALDLRVEAGKAPINVNADAGRAANLNSDLVDGRSFERSDGTLFHEGTCIETSSRGPTDRNSAEDDCLGEGGRLPTVAELQTFRNHPGADFEGGDLRDAEYTSVAFQSDTTPFTVLVRASDGQDIIVNPNGAEQKYRCVVLPS